MDEPVPRHIDIADVDGIGKRSFAQIGLIKNSDYAIKIASNNTHQHHEREKEVYERLGQHTRILQYYGEVLIHSIERTQRGLLLQHHRNGTLDKSIRR
ncbi:hypothetical protein MYCTH_2303780 [Thermothelomyces thermophilus ATCC 42464]|uniref:Protein kinase domain-containing protein n=1 Tax=Thermothelomyces thermophilus (strain ATCC 42464 / BCRC 31852 / DSM 1799) TaxID=573729 RepID=G2QDL6_THET4|nr:uncharacterized protein MYCTH_2303780 [Thermothelomyces thermophilus ATCC 42464]AEO57528.1 hypothetical protein MYCTH_2303780 [Thermothelomyces thermophilus ATCC 42464]